MVQPELERLLDRRVISERLRADPLVHLYELADLDDFFFEHCSYWAYGGEGGPVALLYRGSDPPTLLALARRSGAQLEDMLRALAPGLPDVCYAHFAPGLADALGELFTIEPRGTHAKLALPACARATIGSLPDSLRCEQVSVADRDGVGSFYREAYPDSWFVPRMLETGAYFGIREGARWIAIAGVHALSRSERVATLGNVATSPHHRGLGLARAVCARVCAELLPHVDHIGLNVDQDNHAALACYGKLGFEPVSSYEEVLLRRR